MSTTTIFHKAGFWRVSACFFFGLFAITFIYSMAVAPLLRYFSAEKMPVYSQSSTVEPTPIEDNSSVENTSGKQPASEHPGDRRTDDLRNTYGKVGDTIFNKRTKVAFISPSEFFQDAGVSSFSEVTFDEMNRLPPGMKFVDGRQLTKADYNRAEGR